MFARKHPHALLTILANGHDMNDRFAFKPMVVERDPVTLRIIKVETSSSDTPESLGVLSQMLAFEEIQAKMNGGPLRPARPSKAGSGIWLSEAVQRWCTEQRKSDKWTEETLIYAHAPTLKLFRELVTASLARSKDHLRATPNVHDHAETTSTISLKCRPRWAEIRRVACNQD